MEDLLFNVLCNVVIDYATKLEFTEEESKKVLICEQGATPELWEKIITQPRVKAAFKGGN